MQQFHCGILLRRHAAIVRPINIFRDCVGGFALLLALLACDIGPGDEVLCPALTFVATAAAVIQRLNRDVIKVLEKPEVKERFLQSGSEVATSSPQELAAYIKADMAKMGKLIREAGIRAN